MRTITIELDNLTAEEQETVRRLAEKKKKPYWVPKNGERYFFILSDAAFDDSICHCDIMDDGAISIGNCFKTKEEAKEAIKRMQMQTKWKRLSLEAGEADNPWDGIRPHFFAYWNCVDKKFSIDSNQVRCSEKTYFPKLNSLKAAIAELGEENVKKYILGVR